MPITKSAIKHVRVSARKQKANKSYHSLTKTSVAKAEKLVAAKNVEKAQPAVAEAISVLDKAAGKGIIHKNSAARRKSRLMKKLNAAKKPAAA